MNKKDKIITTILGLVPLTIVLYWLFGLPVRFIYSNELLYYALVAILSLLVIFWLKQKQSSNLKTNLITINLIIFVIYLQMTAMYVIENVIIGPSYPSTQCANAICDKCKTKGNKRICTKCIRPADEKEIEGKCIYSINDIEK